MRFALLTLALLAAVTPARAVCTPPRCIDVTVPVPHRLKVPDATVRLILPDGYDASRKRYPVLLLLHGAGDTYAGWTDNTDVEAFTADLDLIVVMPDSGHDANAGFYTDWQDGSRQWETFHTHVLRQWVDRHYRTLRGRRHRAVAGLSMGGFGAMSYAARHVQSFGAAASFSGALDTLYPNPANPIVKQLGIVAPGIWGDPVADAKIWKAHNPTDLAPQLRKTALFLATGDGTRGGPLGDVDDPLAYGIEAVVAIMTSDFAAALDAAGIPYTKDFYGPGYHGWVYWERELHWALPQMMTLIGPAR